MRYYYCGEEEQNNLVRCNSQAGRHDEYEEGFYALEYL